jgi:hypothetical protein
MVPYNKLQNFWPIKGFDSALLLRRSLELGCLWKNWRAFQARWGLSLKGVSPACSLPTPFWVFLGDSLALRNRVQTSERMRRRTARVPLNRLGFPICGTGRRTLITSMMSLESGAQPEDSRPTLRLSSPQQVTCCGTYYTLSQRVPGASNGPDALGVPETLRESRAPGLFYGQAIL